MKKALPLATVQEVHLYGRSLLAQKKPKEAFDIFKMNYDKNPGVFTTNVGMVRAYSAIGNYKKALELAQKALPQSDAVNKPSLERMIKLLQEGKDVNQ
ncbi:MAG: tetratricopeptide repeat protein, partial [Chitinophagaceae bacterium]